MNLGSFLIRLVVIFIWFGYINELGVSWGDFLISRLISLSEWNISEITKDAPGFSGFTSNKNPALLPEFLMEMSYFSFI